MPRGMVACLPQIKSALFSFINTILIFTADPNATISKDLL
jgi:hypothetical protein